MDKKGGGASRFSVEIFFCVAVPKNFIGEPFSVSFISGSKNFMLQRPMSRFSLEKFLSHSAGKFRREPFCAVFQKTSGSEKFSDKNGGGEHQDSPSNSFCITVPKNFIGEPFSV